MRRLSAVLTLPLLAACASAAPSGTDLLGEGAPAWFTVGSETLHPAWRLEDGVLSLTRAGGGDITNGELYGDFELTFDWRVAPGGNSGVFYFVDLGHDGPAYETGPEYQVLDNARHADGASPLTSAGAVYGLFPTEMSAARPAGEWNRGRINARGGTVEHWLNGVRTARYTLGSETFETRVAETKFAAWAGSFGRTAKGVIVLQDHGDVVSYRNVRVREVE